MRLLSSLLSLLLLLSPVLGQQPNKVKGLTLPAAITFSDTDYQKRVVPVFDDPSKVLDAKWIVIGNGKADPVFTVKGAGSKSVLYLTVPEDPAEVVLVYCYALYAGDKPWVTDPAATVLERSGTTPPVVTPPVTTPPVTTPPVNPIPPVVTPPVSAVDVVFAGVKNIHAILVVDAQTTNREMAQVTTNQTYFKKHFEQPNTKNHWWTYDIRATQLQSQGVTKKLTDAQGKLIVPLPVIVLIDGNASPAKMIGNPMPIPLTGDAAKTCDNILTAIAGVLKK